MGNKINYQARLLDFLEAEKAAGRVPRLLLHACCAPCASSCLEVLDRYAQTDVFFYNPNITAKEEYEYRLAEIKRLVTVMELSRAVSVIEGRYEPERFMEMAKGLENEPERGIRCHGCYRLRLEETAKTAAAGGYDLFATTLTLSPLKPADIINEIGLGLQKSQGRMSGEKNPQGLTDEVRQYSMAAGTESGSFCRYLPSDFKKNNGYLRSIELSKEYGLYRQNYCGCVFSKNVS
ncbi:MAG: epoxyqueuosine reductase QueH [Lachnospiraceae bacterium]|nr:epoxyqueuosine reductase QueH [Lachnospiraceae bacterium]